MKRMRRPLPATLSFRGDMDVEKPFLQQASSRLCSRRPVIVIDYGTATTYDLVDANGSFLYGVTAPGIRISAKALWQDAAKLPEIEIKKPDSILAKETITSMQAGLVYGQIGQTEYIVRHMKEEANLGEIKVVATGGLGRIIASETSMIDVYDPNLTLKGMNLIYKKQNRKSGRIKQS